MQRVRPEKKNRPKGNTWRKISGLINIVDSFNLI